MKRKRQGYDSVPHLPFTQSLSGKGKNRTPGESEKKCERTGDSFLCDFLKKKMHRWRKSETPRWRDRKGNESFCVASNENIRYLGNEKSKLNQDDDVNHKSHSKLLLKCCKRL